MFAGALALVGCSQGVRAQNAERDWRADWAVESGFAIEIDSDGFSLPTAIAVVAEPGLGPDAPLYFVTEMNGAIKVVTRDRSVRVFARDFFSLQPVVKQPWNFQEVGLAGICLAPEQGYVFATFAYSDSYGVLRNNVVRFETDPKTFSSVPRALTFFTDIFSAFESAPAHQVGPCQVSGDRLYVSVGDAQQPQRSRDPRSIQGKILRLTLDGHAAPDNPYYRAADARAPSGYVWASGLRNPFGLKAHEGRIFVADNGPNVDRLVEIERGQDYLWDGTDWSIGAAAAAVIAPAVGPAQMDAIESGPFAGDAPLRLFVAASGNLVWTDAPEAQQRPGVLTADYRLGDRRMLRAPRYFVRYVGTGRQMVVGLAFAGDDLLLLPLYDVAQGRSAVLRVEYRPTSPHPVGLKSTADAYTLFVEKGCIGCHRIGDSGGTVGPVLGPELSTLFTRLASADYAASVAAVDRLTEEPFVSWRRIREEVMAATGRERVRLWLKARIRQPRFDSQTATMPPLDVSDSEAEVMAAALLVMAGSPPQEEASGGWSERTIAMFDERIGTIRYRHLVLSFLSGLGSTLLLLGFSRWNRKRHRGRR